MSQLPPGRRTLILIIVIAAQCAANVDSKIAVEYKMERDGQPQTAEDILFSPDNPGSAPSGRGGNITPNMHIIGSEDGEEIVEVELLETGSDSWRLNFESYGRFHKLDLEKSRSNDLSDVPIRILGMSEDRQKQVKDKLKRITFAHDRERGASVALHLSGNSSTPSLKGGAFKMGHHHFEITPHGTANGKVRVKRRSTHGYSLTHKFHDTDSDFHHKEKRSVTPAPEKKIREKITIDPLSATIEILLVIDYGAWTAFEQPEDQVDETDKAVDLVVAYTHVVRMTDRSYGNMRNEDLQIRVKLAGLLVFANADVYPEISEDVKYFDILSQRWFIERLVLLKTLESWVVSEGDVIPPYDHITLITGYTLFNRAGYGLAGVAYLGTMCSDRLSLSLVSPTLSPLSNAADVLSHEIGHSLGAKHDTMGYGCPADNYMMNSGWHPLDNIDNQVLFSCCSQRAFYYESLYSSRSQCLFEDSFTESFNSTIDDIVSNTPLGQVYDADDQCYMSLGESACGDWLYELYNISVCQTLWCDDGSACIGGFAARALDGTDCGEDMWCIEGQCVSQNQNSSTAKLKDHSCNVSECYLDEFRCTAGYNTDELSRMFCIPQSKVCDGTPDCSDGSDETDCSVDIQPDCYEGFTACADRLSHNLTVPLYTPHFCLYDAWVCDSQIDCIDGSDEANCTDVPEQTSTQSTQELCGDNFTSDSGNLDSPKSPLPPSHYPDNLNCTWTLSVTSGYISILLYSVHIECSDSLKVIDNSDGSVIADVCGNPLKKWYDVTTHSVTVTFVTDSSVNDRGWRIQWTATRPDDGTTLNTTPAPVVCGGDLMGNRGNLTSPNYPNIYPNNLNCTWRVSSTDENQIIVLRFPLVRIENYNDWIAIYDGNSGFLIRVLTGLSYESTVTVKGLSNSVLIQFYSDNVRSSSEDLRWFMRWIAVNQNYEVTTQMSTYNPANDPQYNLPFCIGIHSGTTGVLTSTNYPRNYLTGLRCRYDITVPSGIISIRVNHLDLEPQADYLHVLDMNTDTVLRSLTGLVRNNTIIEGKSSSMRLIFVTSFWISRPGFSVTWFISGCEAQGNTYRTVPDTECTKFTQTVHSLGIGPFQFDCPEGTAFDSSLCICNHKSAFHCPL